MFACVLVAILGFDGVLIAQCNHPLPPRERRGYGPNRVIKYAIDPLLVDSQMQNFRQCMEQGIESWHNGDDIRIVPGIWGIDANLVILQMPDQPTPQGSYVPNQAIRDSSGYVQHSFIHIAGNLAATTGRVCSRVKGLLAHETGHALGLGEGPDGSVMRQGQLGEPFGGTDLRPESPTPCDRDAARMAHTLTGPSLVGLFPGCFTGYFDEWGCCGGDSGLDNGLFATYTGVNQKPAVHVHWPQQNSLYAAPFN
jgi:hypothetical protein